MGFALNFPDPSQFHAPHTRLDSYESTVQDNALLDMLRKYVAAAASGNTSVFQQLVDLEDTFEASSFSSSYALLVLVLYAPGCRRILVARTAKHSFSYACSRLLRHSRIKEFSGKNFRLQLDFVRGDLEEVNFFQVGMKQTGNRHFQLGVDGLSFIGPDKKQHLFLPGDAYVRSIMGMGQLRDYLFRGYGEDYIRQGVFSRFRSESYICSQRGCWLKLYRGHPQVGELTKTKVIDAVENAVSHIQLTQEPNGKFLYYYDAALDSQRDHEHPKRDLKKNPYYNILRHCGGGLTCLYYERYSKNGRSLPNIRLALDYFIDHAVEYETAGRTAAYIYSERKSKLGGAGIGLYWLADYQILTGDSTYREWADKIAWHMLHQITDTGEFIYYNVYLDKPVGAEENDQYFSFYYPGEAVCGLARYALIASDDVRLLIIERLRKALDFLLNIRPTTRAEHYTTIPSDSWLMMGIMELWDLPEMRDPAYAEFVFADAQKMIEQMYKVTDAPYPDYAGAFYYDFGDYPYADGARCEGLLGAYELALKMGKKDIADGIWTAMELAAWAVLHLVNTEDSTYSCRRPEIALGGIRFKYTRQWFRIDTIQHVASFYGKMLPHWRDRYQD